jgi:hypothetical protein
MKSPNNFAFSIGENNQAGIDQFPNLRNLPSFIPALIGYELGFALGLAYLKLRRPWPTSDDEKMELDSAPEWLAGLLTEISSENRLAIRHGFLAVPDGFVDLALNRPDLVPDLIAQVDALENEDLQALCLDSLNSSRQVSGFFDRLDGTQ